MAPEDSRERAYRIPARERNGTVGRSNVFQTLLLPLDVCYPRQAFTFHGSEAHT